MRTIGICATAERQRGLSALVTAYLNQGYCVKSFDVDTPTQDQLQTYAKACDALLVAGSGRRSPATVLSGPVIRCSDERLVPVGWVPHLNDFALERFSHTAAALHQRPKIEHGNAIALLAQWQPRYLKLTKRIDQILTDVDLSVYKWTSDVVFREDMLKGIGLGLGAAFYLGHGRPNGWVGYQGLRAHHFDTREHHPLGALFCLCCRSASRKKTGVSFAERLVTQGVAAAVFASTTDTLHLNNTRWALNLIQGLLEPCHSIGDLITRSLPLSDRAIDDYRIIGDPLAPLQATKMAASLADKIPIYA